MATRVELVTVKLREMIVTRRLTPGSRMPLVAPVAILFTNDQRDDAYARMVDAHSDHVQVLAALLRGEGERADYLMREHAYRSRERLGALLRSDFDLDASPAEGSADVG